MSENSAKDRERIVAFERELQADPRSLTFVQLADEHNRLGNFDDAANVSNKGLVYHPDSVAGRLALAMAEHGRNNVKQALEQLKRALLIDQDNPKALALMGQILLEKGLAKRAVQFLSHAVKLDPDEPEYAELFKRAKKMAENEAPPVFRGDAIKDSSPWSEDSESSEIEARAADAEHTVFAPEALKKMRARDQAKKESRENGKAGALDDALANLPVSDDIDAESEPTRFDGRARKSTISMPGELPPPRRVEPSDAPERREEPTAYDARQASLSKRKPKVGGSAAEFSRVMRSAKEGSTVAPSVKAATGMASDLSLGSSEPPQSADGGEKETAYLRPRSMLPPPPPPADAPKPADLDDESEDATKDEAHVPRLRAKAAAIAEAEAKAKESAEIPIVMGKPATQAKPSGGEAPAKADPVPKAEKPAKAEKAAEPPAEKPEPDKTIGPASTRMVDEALWALLGGKAQGGPEAKGGSVVNERDKAPEKAPAAEKKEKAAEKAAPAKKEKKGEEDEGGGAQRKGAAPMVVRTSETFGTALRVSVIAVLAGTMLWVGYATAIAVSGPPPEIASEEVKGIASDLEKGSLAALISAEEKIQTLGPTLPQLSELLDGALAEVYAHRWASFGRDPEMKEKALAKLQALSSATPTVELIAAQVALSTSATERATLDIALAARLEEYPDSPKSWVLRAKIAAADGKEEAAEAALYKARGINPQHRWTLLELARWHAKQGAYGAAFNYFEMLSQSYPEDIEAAIDRYVLGQITGRDPWESQATSSLQGLVREELAEVADDEVGRASLAFAVMRFARGDLPGGVEELGKAELAYKKSSEMKSTVAGVLLAAGEWDRARAAYKDALELDPSNEELRVGLARASFGDQSGLKADPELVKTQKSGTGATAYLPFGTVRLVFGKFSIADVESNREVFPEAAYAAAKRNTKGPELTKALESVSMVALAELKAKSGNYEEALNMLEEATKLRDDAHARVAYGRVYTAKKDLDAATRAYKRALELDDKNVQARIGLANALAAKNEPVAAIDVLEPLEQGDLVVPKALLLLSRLRLKRGDYEGAARSLEQLTEIEPANAAALLDLGEVQHRLKRTDEAYETIKTAVKSSSKNVEKLSPVQALYVGRFELERDNDKRGVALLKQAATGDDAPDEAHFYYGKALLKTKKTKKTGRRELELFRKLSPSSPLADEAERLLR
jgi:tetratricopeptide (TPR) repeat protein